MLALGAGADVLLMPADAEAAIDGVAAAVRNGHIKPARIDESVMRILTAKAHVGLATKRLVDLEEIHSVVNSTESNASAQQISDRAVTLVRNMGDLIPLKTPATTAFFILRRAGLLWRETPSEPRCTSARRREHNPRGPDHVGG